MNGIVAAAALGGKKGAAKKRVPVANNTVLAAQTTDRTTTGTSRRPHVLAVGVTDLVFGYANILNNGTQVATNGQDADPGTAIVIKASVEIAGTIYRLTFGGLQQVTIDPGGYIASDPLPVDLAAGTTIYSRTAIISGTWHYNAYTGAGAIGGQGGWVATTDLTAPGSAAIADSSNSILYAPSAIMGLPASSVPSVYIAGDSIGHGYGDGPGTVGWQGRNTVSPALAGGGYIARALYGVAGFINAAIPGDQASWFAALSGRFRRLAHAAQATTMICEYGRNDISATRTLAQIQADLISIWTMGANRGLRVLQTTITPKPASTDGWRTQGAQTAATDDSVRNPLNDWIRAGAPINSGTKAPVAIGTSGALLAGQGGHPLAGYFEVADQVESARNSGIYKTAANTRSVADAVTTAANAVITSATANFTAADLGRQLTVAGAGAAGALFVTTIQAVNGATSITASSNATTAVTGATAYVFDALTTDGTHLSPYGASVAAAGVDVTKIV